MNELESLEENLSFLLPTITVLLKWWKMLYINVTFSQPQKYFGLVFTSNKESKKARKEKKNQQTSFNVETVTKPSGRTQATWLEVLHLNRSAKHSRCSKKKKTI